MLLLKNNPQQDRLLKIGVLGMAALLLLGFSLTLLLNNVRLHYSNLHLQSSLAKMRLEPLLKKYSVLPEPPEYLDLETLRALGEKSGLSFVSSKSGEAALEIIFQGGYSAFLNYLRALAAENIGEISQLDITGQQQKIIIKGAVYEK
ncbi:hypothetical protein RDn1_352 [Candidatus Termititenax dinenymphae]|uniref:Uncharacterized protein n=1 Tax=Candidatus Termititenax dinenymphae TaxID=2218523 RepID=A0A388TK64_9BACT|nr:hypothetical protein RDn1_352 [Candidatus Termititenax dinenymphae]